MQARGIVWIAVLLSIAMELTSLGQDVASIPVEPYSFSSSRAIDPGGAGNAYVQDWIKSEIAISPVEIRAGTYRLNFIFDDWEQIEFSTLTQRIDLVAAIGHGDSHGSPRSSGANQSQIDWQIDNLSLTSSAGYTKSFYASYNDTQAHGVGVDEIRYVASYIDNPGEPFRLRSLATTFTVPATWPSTYLPGSPSNTVTLWIAGAGNFLAVDVPDLAPLSRILPEPSGALLLTVLTAGVLRRCRGAR